jgi:hypothetical protein
MNRGYRMAGDSCVEIGIVRAIRAVGVINPGELWV